MTKLLTLANLDEAAALLKAGGILVYPTEAVFGLGCDPRCEDAVVRLYALKQRATSQGFLLIASDERQLEPYVDWSIVPLARLQEIRASWPGPCTWVLPRRDGTPRALTGDHGGIAVRVTAHRPAAALCRRFGGALVSTSANLHGRSPARSVQEVVRQLDTTAVEAVLRGPLGGLLQPTPIRDGLTGSFVRR